MVFFRSTAASSTRPVLALYTILALGLSWPLLPRILTHVPGVAQWAFDESTFLWNIWYFKHALVDQLQSPLRSELIWYPLGIDLVLYTYNFFHALIAQPLMLAINLPFASNVALLSSTVLSGYGTYLLVRYLLARHVADNAPLATPLPAVTIDQTLAAFVAGALYAFASNRAIYAALGHYDMVTTQWIPFYALMLLRSLDRALTPGRRYRAAALAGFFFALNGLAEMITALFLAIFTIIVVLIYLLNLLRTERTEQVNRADLSPSTQAAGPSLFNALLLPIRSLLVTGLVALLFWGPALAPILNQFLTDDFSLQGWGEAIPLSTDLLGWVTPTPLHPQWGTELIPELRRIQERARSEEVGGFRDLNTVFLGWATLAFALIGLVRYRRRVAVWLWTTLIFGVFTLGPFLQINGRYRFDLDGVEATFPLPFALLHYIPIIKANRAPNRNSVLLMLGLAVLVGYGLWWLLTKTRRWLALSANGRQQPQQLRTIQSGIALVFTALLLFEHLTIPAPLSDARIPTVYSEIAADPAPVSVMQVPLGWRNSFGVFGAERTQLQYYQSAHGKPMLGGNISRAPDFKMNYFQRLPYFQVMENLQFDRPVAEEQLAAATAQADELAYLYNTGYVLFYPPIFARKPYEDNWQPTWEFVKRTMPLEAEPFWTDAGIEAYRVIQPEGSDEFTLDLGEAGTYPYRGEGWDDAETDAPYEASAIWATAAASRVFLPLRQVDPNATYQLQLRVHPFAYPGSAPQSVGLAINGWAGDPQPLADSWNELQWTVPGSALVNSVNRLTLTWAWTAVPRTVIGGERLIGETGRELPIDVDITAFGEGGWIALYDEAGVQTDGSAGRRGANVTVLADDGTIIEKVGFDTAANAFESEALAAFLAGIEQDQTVLIASNGAAGAYLTDDAVRGLRGLGAAVTLEQLQAQAFAIVGVQGAEVGRAAVVQDPERAFLRIARNPDRRSLAAAVDSISIAPVEMAGQ